jgi:hypothetical protein
MSSEQSGIRTVRVFLTSPADVEFERQRVDCVAERLNHAFADLLQFKTVRWERRLYSSHAGFQEQIPEAAECDLVIAVFWSRLGTPLPNAFARMESGERYPSGSAYEVLSALEARRKGDRPDVYVFRKTESVADSGEEAKGQRQDLNAFFSRWFQTPDGQFLRAYHRFRTPDEFELLVERLLRHWVAEHVPRDQTLLWPIETMGSPFRALQPFDAKHTAIYFGRDRKVTRTIEQLQSVGRAYQTPTLSGPRAVPFLLIVGESGAGKSSLMRAGLAPRLTAAGVVPGVDLWRTAIMRVGDDPDPFVTLARALMVAHDEEHGFGAALPELREQGFESPEALAPLLAREADFELRRKRAPAVAPIIRTLAHLQAGQQQRGGYARRLRANLLLLVDQLENIFAADVTDQQRTTLARLLFALAATRRIWVVATVRSDMYPRLITPGPFLALKDAGTVYDLAAPGESELIEIVHRSAAAAGLVYERHPATGEPLDERILRDAQGKNTLPLLQFALERLFQARAVVELESASGDRAAVKTEVRLTHAAYDAMHGLDGAINQTAEAALSTLGKVEIGALPRLLRSLAVPMRDLKSATGGASDLTVRTVPLGEAVPDAPTSRLVKELTEARIIVATGAEEAAGHDDAGFIGVAHQRVFESWERARGIIAEHKDFFRIRDDVETQRQRWYEKGRPAALLLAKGVPLAEGQKIVAAYGEELSKDVRAYVTASNRRAQRLNIFMGATAAVFALLFVATALFWFKADSAQRVATTNYEAAKGAVGDLVGVITQGLQNIEGIRVQTVQSVLEIVDKTIKKVQTVSAEDPEIARIRGEMLFQIGKAFQKKEERASALAAAEDSLAVRSKLTHFDQRTANPAAFAAAPPQWRWELSQSLEFVGDLYREMQNYQLARPSFESALEVRRQLVEETGENENWEYGISQVYTRIGDLDFSSNLAAALQNYQGTLAIAAKYFRRRMTDDRWQRELSWAFNKIGDVRLRTGDAKAKAGDLTAKAQDYPAALAAFSNSLCLRRQISAREPAKTELTRDISYSLDRVGNARLRLDNIAEAQVAYFESLAVRRALVNSVSDDARYLGDVAVSLTSIAEAFLAEGDLKGAFAFYSGAVDVRLQLTLRDQKDERARRNLTNAQRRAEEIRKQLVAAYPQQDASNPEWRKTISDAEAESARRRSAANDDPRACWDAVVAAVDQAVGTSAQATAK